MKILALDEVDMVSGGDTGCILAIGNAAIAIAAGSELGPMDLIVMGVEAVTVVEACKK